MAKNVLKCEYCNELSVTMLGIPYFKTFCDGCKDDAWKDHENSIEEARNINWDDDDELSIAEFERLCLKLSVYMLDNPDLKSQLKDLNPMFIGPFSLSQQIKGVLVPRLSEYMSTWKNREEVPANNGTYRVFKSIPLRAFIEAAVDAGLITEEKNGGSDDLH